MQASRTATHHRGDKATQCIRTRGAFDDGKPSLLHHIVDIRLGDEPSDELAHPGLVSQGMLEIDFLSR